MINGLIHYSSWPPRLGSFAFSYLKFSDNPILSKIPIVRTNSRFKLAGNITYAAFMQFIVSTEKGFCDANIQIQAADVHVVPADCQYSFAVN